MVNARVLTGIALAAVACGGLGLSALPAAAREPTPSLGDLRDEALFPRGCVPPHVYEPGDLVHVHGAGFGPGEKVIVRLVCDGGANVVELGTVSAGASGLVDGVFGLPLVSPRLGNALLEELGLRPDGGAQLLLAEVAIVTSVSADSDADGVPDVCDRCPHVPDPAQADADGDGLGDACDPCPLDAENDIDHDGLCADRDPCPWDPENDADHDGVCESEDNCRRVANPDQRDSNGNGIGDACER
jgi:hypothetical protein